MKDMASSPPDRWLRLIHQLAAKPATYAPRSGGGCRGSARLWSGTPYASPASEQTGEYFEWLVREIAEGGTEAMICERRLMEVSSIRKYGRCSTRPGTKTTRP
jgi:hypothetical protein